MAPRTEGRPGRLWAGGRGRPRRPRGGARTSYDEYDALRGNIGFREPGLVEVDPCAFWSTGEGQDLIVRCTMNNLRFAAALPQVWSARKREKRVSVRCGEIRRNVGQEVKEVDRDLSVVCPGRQLNLWGGKA